MADVVITKFEADFTGFDAAIDSQITEIDKLQKSMTDATGSGKNLSGAMGDAGKKADGLGNASKKASVGVDDLGKKTGAAGGVVGILKDKLNQTFPIFGQIAEGAKLLGTAMTTALGPVGIAIGLVVLAFAALVKVFAGTEEGSERVAAVIEPLKAQFQALIGVVQTIGKVAFNTLALLGNLATGDLNSAAKNFDDIKTSAGDAASEISNLGATLSSAGEKGARIAAIKEELEDLAISIAENEARINREFQEQYAIAGDVNASAQERKQAAEKAIELQKELTALKIKDLDLQIEELKLRQSLNDTSDEERLALAKLVAAREQAVADELSATRRVKNTINTLNKQESDKAIAEGKRVAAERAKAAEEAQKVAQKKVEDTAKAEEKVTEIVKKAAQERAKLTMTEPERAEFEITVNTDKVLEDTRAAFEELKALVAGDSEELNRVTAQAAQAELDIIAKRDSELSALRDAERAKVEESNAASLDAIRAVTEEKSTLEREAINKQFDDLESQAERLKLSEEDTTAMLVELQRARGDALAAVKDEQQLAEEEKLKAKQDAQIAIIQGSSQALAGVLEAFASGQITSAKEAGKALVGVAIDTVGAIVQAQVLEIIARSAAFGAKAGPVGAAAGIAGGIAIGAIIKGLLSQLKAQIVGNYQGDPYVQGQQTWGGRDGHLRRLDTGERVVTAKHNAEHWDMFEAIRKGRFEDWKDRNMNPVALNFERIAAVPSTAELLVYNFEPKVNAYLDSPEGRRTAAEITLPGFFDKNIVRASREAAKEQRTTNKLLRAMIEDQPTSRPSKRTW